MKSCNMVRPACLLVAAMAAMLPVIQAQAADPSAPDSFGQPVATTALGDQRGGEDTPTDSFNTITTINSQQDLSAENSGNTITAGGDVTSGAITIDSNAMSNLNGMTNVVINSAPQSNVQGGMTLNLILQQAAPQP